MDVFPLMCRCGTDYDQLIYTKLILIAMVDPYRVLGLQATAGKDEVGVGRSFRLITQTGIFNYEACFRAAGQRNVQVGGPHPRVQQHGPEGTMLRLQAGS